MPGRRHLFVPGPTNIPDRILRALNRPSEDHRSLDFAKLTGDFNPIHWVPAYARASGFRSCILHGFATMSYAMEAIRSARACALGHGRCRSPARR